MLALGNRFLVELRGTVVEWELPVKYPCPAFWNHEDRVKLKSFGLKYPKELDLLLLWPRYMEHLGHKPERILRIKTVNIMTVSRELSKRTPEALALFKTPEFRHKEQGWCRVVGDCAKIPCQMPGVEVSLETIKKCAISCLDMLVELASYLLQSFSYYYFYHPPLLLES